MAAHAENFLQPVELAKRGKQNWFRSYIPTGKEAAISARLPRPV
jgi:hypothetical protein